MTDQSRGMWPPFIFIVKKNELYTPPQCMGTLRGITRDTILEIASKKGISVHEHVITRHEVYISDECFLTGTAADAPPGARDDGDLAAELQMTSPLRDLISSRNSARVSGRSRKEPSIAEVTALEFCFSTPLIIMHM